MIKSDKLIVLLSVYHSDSSTLGYLALMCTVTLSNIEGHSLTNLFIDCRVTRANVICTQTILVNAEFEKVL